MNGERRRYGTPRLCLVCGQSFAPAAGNSKQKFCSHVCYGVSKRGRNWSQRKLTACEYCQKEFAGGVGKYRFCSSDCYRSARQSRKFTFQLVSKKICEICHKEFTAHREKQRFCSRPCRARSVRQRRDVVVCKGCKKKFEPRTVTQEFCGPQCSGQSGRKHPKFVICANCGKQFRNLFLRGGGENRKFCSFKCSVIAHTKNKPIHCERCHKEFKPYSRTQRFCSRGCAAEPLLLRNCTACGRGFKPSLAAQRRCPSCRVPHSRVQWERPCLLCGTEFTASHAHQKYCSQECRKVGHSNAGKAAWTPQRRAAQSERAKSVSARLWADPEYHAYMQRVQNEYWSQDGVRELASLRYSEWEKNNPERDAVKRHKISEAKKRQWADPVVGPRMLEALLGRMARLWADPAFQEKNCKAVGEATKKRWDDPVYREKQREQHAKAMDELFLLRDIGEELVESAGLPNPVHTGLWFWEHEFVRTYRTRYWLLAEVAKNFLQQREEEEKSLFDLTTQTMQSNLIHQEKTT